MGSFFFESCIDIIIKPVQWIKATALHQLRMGYGIVFIFFGGVAYHFSYFHELEQ